MTEQEKADVALNVIHASTRAFKEGTYVSNKLVEAAEAVLLKALQSDT